MYIRFQKNTSCWRRLSSLKLQKLLSNNQLCPGSHFTKLQQSGYCTSSSLTTFLSQKFLLEIICRKLQLPPRRQLMIPILWAKKSTTWPLLFMDMVVVLVEREWEIDVPIGFSESFSKMTIWSRDSIILLKLSNYYILLWFLSEMEFYIMDFWIQSTMSERQQKSYITL